MNKNIKIINIDLSWKEDLLFAVNNKNELLIESSETLHLCDFEGKLLASFKLENENESFYSLSYDGEYVILHNIEWGDAVRRIKFDDKERKLSLSSSFVPNMRNWSYIDNDTDYIFNHDGAFSYNHLLLSYEEGDRLRIFDIENVDDEIDLGKEAEDEEYISAYFINSDSSLIVCAFNKVIKIWEDYEFVKRIDTEDSIEGITISKDKKYLLYSTDENEIKILDISNYENIKHLKTIADDERKSNNLAIDNDNSKIAYACKEGIKIIDFPKL